MYGKSLSPALMSLTPEDLKEILLQVQQVAGDLVLVGGQAVNLLATHYANDSQEWQALRPYASRDLDFYGGRVEVVVCANALGGKAYVNREFDASPNAGIVTVQYRNNPLQIDILATVFGISDGEIVATAFPFRGSGALSGLELKVLNPVLCLEGKLKSLSGLPQAGRQDAKHCVLSLLILGEYLKEQCLDHEPRAGLRLIERVLSTGTSDSSLSAWQKLGLCVENAVPVQQLQTFENPLWQRFLEIRWPQALQHLKQRRERYQQISQIIEQRQLSSPDNLSDEM
jgi:hypothetical protein